MIKQIIFALLLGTIASIILLQNDPAVKAYVGKQAEQIFINALECNVQLDVSDINLFARRLVFNEVKTQPHNTADWRWTCKKFIIQFSLWELFSCGKLGLYLTLEDLDAHTDVAGSEIAIMPHLKQVMIGFSPDAPVLLRTLTFHNAKAQSTELKNGHKLTFAWDSALDFSEDRLKALLHCEDGTCSIAKQPILDSLSGTVSLDIPYDMTKPWSVIADLRSHVPLFASPGINCFCTGTINNARGTFAIQSSDNSICIEPFIINFDAEQNSQATIKITLKQLLTLVHLPTTIPTLDGNCTINIRYKQNVEGSTIDGTVAATHIMYGTQEILEKCKATFTQAKGKWHGTINARYDKQLGAQGQWEWDTTNNRAQASLINAQEISHNRWPQWFIAPEKATINILYDNLGKLHCTGKSCLSNHNTDASISVAGSIGMQHDEITIEGTANNHYCQGTFVWQPTFGIKEFLYKKEGKESFIALHGKKGDPKRFSGFITLPCINTIAPLLGNFTLQGEGKFDCWGVLKQNELLLKTCFSQGTIRLPQTYNCVTNIEAITRLDLANKRAIINNLRCNLYAGTCSMRRAIIACDDQWQPSIMHLPLVLDHCLLNVQKDLFATVSGNLLFDKHAQKTATLDGHLILNRSQLANNIFSRSFHETVAQYTQQSIPIRATDVICNVTLGTQHPIRIKNSFFDTKARVNLRAQGQLYSPGITGTITLEGGSLNFPYKPLFITKGDLTLDTRNSNEPLFELIAKNKIKKYEVCLSAAGSLNHHQIDFSSKPPLNNEQIIGLLLLGFEEASLSSIAPALLVNNIPNLLLGSDPASLLQRSLDQLPDTFKRVHFIPSFNDQSARGGLRGNLEVEINDRWHASIRKNFNLQEDTHFALEYLLSDDISIKGIRDEHRDISSEVEMRFTF